MYPTHGPTTTRQRFVNGATQNGATQQNGAFYGDNVEDASFTKAKPRVGWSDKMAAMVGFRLSDVTSWAAFVRLVNRPSHPSSLAFVRIVYGILMLFDTVMDRGMAMADVMWDENTCHFPLIPGLTQLPPEWMMMLYLLMCIGLVGMILGLGYRGSSLMFILPYTYLWLLDKMKWSNHGALFLWLGIHLALSDANRYWSLDGVIWPEIRNADVPLWNYYILRLQVFILYFISGLKKFHPDWMAAYSRNLGYRKALEPLRLFMSAATINQHLHYSGIFLDVFLGFFLFFDKSRPLGFVMGVGFHVMNRFLFPVALLMFPYMSIVTMFIFCAFDWPVVLTNKIFGTKDTRGNRHGPMVSDGHSQPSGHNGIGSSQPSDNCLYQKSHLQDVKHTIEPLEQNGGTKHVRTSPRLRHTVAAIFVLFFTTQQFFTPYSHFITKGWSGWREGMSGYSWDMMIQCNNASFRQIKYVQKHTGQVGYVSMKAFVMRNHRWATHGDQTKDFAKIVANRLELDHNITDVSIYFDVWRSLNRRIFQRSLNPEVDFLTAPWNLFERPSWITPVLHGLDHWRPQIDRRREEVRNWANFTRVRFFADSPHMPLRHYVRKDVEKVNLTVLEGQVIVQLTNQNVTVNAGQTLHNIPPMEYHVVTVTSPKPAVLCYMYVDAGERRTDEEATKLSLELQQRRGVTGESVLELEDLEVHPYDAPDLAKLKRVIYERRGETVWEHVRLSVEETLWDWRRSYVGVMASIRSIRTGEKMVSVMADMWGGDTSYLSYWMLDRSRSILTEEHTAHQFI